MSPIGSHIKNVVQSKKLALVRELDVIKKKLSVLETVRNTNDPVELELELFDLWDVANQGHLSFEELANGIAEMPDLANSLSVEEVYELRNKADSNRIDRTEFGHLLEKLVEKSGGDLKDWVELLVLVFWPPEHAIMSTSISEGWNLDQADGGLEDSVKAAAKDGRMRNLFALFDADLDNKISFRDIAMSLRKIAPHVPLEKASEAAVKVLLDFDKDHDRVLDYMEFVHFISAFLNAGGLQFAQVADALVLAAARPDPSEEEVMQFESVIKSENFGTFTDYRLHQIFELWDRDGDGYISFKELCLGLHKFEPTKPLKLAVEHAATLLQRSRLSVSEDDPESHKLLDRSEFADVLTEFIKESGAQFEQVADYLVAISSSAVDDVAAVNFSGWFFKPLDPHPTSPKHK